jgi:hypothetical protein
MLYWKHLTNHFFRTKFHYFHFSHAGNIIIIAPTIREAPVLMSLFMKYAVQMTFGDIYTRFHNWRFRHSSNSGGITSTV